MPLSDEFSDSPPPETLPQRLRTRLLPNLHSTKAAAWVRVHAGSHDAPEAYPGMAHFLEHLLFLGSRNYAVEDGLMPFVQACGGQLNASTRERHTDFFFQVPAGKYEGALLRLLDMLAYPTLDLSAQRREREVLHAEFLARGQDTETVCDAALGRAFGTHPFSGFHAGHRDTLPVEEAAFQQALSGYHQHFYQSGQLELLLAGPQAESELRRLALRADALLPKGEWIPRKAPALRYNAEAWMRLQLDAMQPKLLVAFGLDEVPKQCMEVLHYLSTWVASEADGGLLQRLRGEALCESLSLRTPYWYATQGVIVIDVSLTDQGMARRERIVAAVLDWLRFFSQAASVWQVCSAEYRRIVDRSLQGAEPLARLRHWVEPMKWDEGDNASRREALAVLIEQMLSTRPLVITADSDACDPVESRGFPLRMAREIPLQVEVSGKQWNWQPPSSNPWLQPFNIEAKTEVALYPALEWHGPEHPQRQGALFLRWRFDRSRPAPAHWHAVWHALQPRIWAAQQAGVALRFEDMGDSWTLGLCGHAETIPAILSDISRSLAELPAESVAAGAAMAERAPLLNKNEMLIRQLLKRLANVLTAAAIPDEPGTPHRSTHANPLHSSTWHGLAIGAPSGLKGAVGAATRWIPGTPARADGKEPSARTDRCWHTVNGSVSDEAALLLFCPLPAGDAACEAAWRVLAVMIESAFFRRLRSELQLGYAVFSRFHQAGQHAGMLFGVQSPTASAEAIEAHIETFLEDFSVTLANRSAAAVSELANDLSGRHAIHLADFQSYADQAWQTRLAGHDADRPARVAEAMQALTPGNLMNALNALTLGVGGWVVVSNQKRGWTDT